MKSKPSNKRSQDSVEARKKLFVELLEIKSNSQVTRAFLAMRSSSFFNSSAAVEKRDSNH